MDVELTPQTFEVLLRDVRDPLIRLSLIRVQIHRLVEALSHRAGKAGWSMSVDAAWLDPGQTWIVFN